MKLKDTQLFHLVIKLTKSFAVPKASTRLKTTRDIIFFRPDFFAKCKNLKQPYCFIKITETLKFREIGRTTIVLLRYQVNEGSLSLYRRLAGDEKLSEVSVYFFVLIITPMLSRIFNEAFMSISNKHNWKTLINVFLHLCHIASKAF